MLLVLSLLSMLLMLPYSCQCPDEDICTLVFKQLREKIRKVLTCGGGGGMGGGHRKLPWSAYDIVEHV